jgi:adenylate cyclase
MTWEIDEFAGDNAGLVVAELELEREDQPFARPAWLGAEVTHLRRYYNVCLVEHPYRAWTEAERRA